MLGKILKVAFSLFLSCCNLSFLKKLFWKPEKNKTVFLRDKLGRITIYRGVNVSNFSKYSPDFLPWQTKEDFARLKDWGFNVVRYLVFWSAIEPGKGVYNDQYVAGTVERIKWLKELGIDVIIDFHQDLYCIKYSGHGFPEWAANDGGIPFTKQQPWNMNYFEPAVVEAFNNFWKDDNLRAAYIDMMSYFLSMIKLDNVIGFDVMNEPFLGTVPKFEEKMLTDFYKKVQAMNASNFKMTMFFEPEIYTSGGIPSNLKFQPDRNCVFYPHYYDPLCHENKPYTKLSKWLLKRALSIKEREAQVFGTPLMVGEFGISPKVKRYIDYLNDFVSITNKGMIGWTYYTYDRTDWSGFGILNPDGSETETLKSLISLYPQKIAGSNPEVEYGTGDNNEEYFLLKYDTNDLERKGTTEIFIPKNKGVTINGVSVPDNMSGWVYNYANQDCPHQYIKISWTK
jgi:endoglycosylceramidase